VAATGQRVALDLGANEQSFTHFRAVLAANTNVAPEHQILLCGPPYKSFDRTQLYEASNKVRDASRGAGALIQRLLLHYSVCL